MRPSTRRALLTLIPVLAAAASWVCSPRNCLYLFTCRSVMRLPGTVAASHPEAHHCKARPQTHPRQRASTAQDSCRRPVRIIVAGQCDRALPDCDAGRACRAVRRLSHQRIAFNSCRDRHCPKCQSLTRAQWLEDRRAEQLPVEYFHVSRCRSPSRRSPTRTRRCFTTCCSRPRRRSLKGHARQSTSVEARRARLGSDHWTHFGVSRRGSNGRSGVWRTSDSPTGGASHVRQADAQGVLPVESRCGAVAVGPVCLLPPLSSGGARVTSP